MIETRGGRSPDEWSVAQPDDLTIEGWYRRAEEEMDADFRGRGSVDDADDDTDT